MEGTMNYCPVCKREYKETGVKQTRRCPVCGSTLVKISDDTMNQVRQKNIRKKD
jgi:rRNA maturation endonuclease Nob1